MFFAYEKNDRSYVSGSFNNSYEKAPIDPLLLIYWGAMEESLYSEHVSKNGKISVVFDSIKKIVQSDGFWRGCYIMNSEHGYIVFSSNNDAIEKIKEKRKEDEASFKKWCSERDLEKKWWYTYHKEIDWSSWK